MIGLLILVVQLVGFGTLALSMHKHHRDLFGAPPRRIRALMLRCLGWGTLMLSLLPALGQQGVSVGIVLWLGLATIAALAVAIALTYGASTERFSVKLTLRHRRAVACPQAESHNA